MNADEIMKTLTTPMPLDDDEKDVHNNKDESNIEGLPSRDEITTPNPNEDSADSSYTKDTTIITLKLKENQPKIVINNTSNITNNTVNDTSNGTIYANTRIKWGDQIKSKKTNWLIQDILPIGGITIIGGDPGTGKTTVALNWASHVTRGKDLRSSCGITCESSGIVLIWSSEEAAEDSIKPRLEAQYADVTKVGFIEGTIINKKEEIFFNPAQDMPKLSDAIKEIEASTKEKIKLIIIDSIADVLSGDSHKNTDARKCLIPLKQLAEKHQLAIIGISHLTKNSPNREEKPLKRIQGAIAVTAVSSMVYITEKTDNKDPENSNFLEQRYVIAIAKNRYGLNENGYYYHLESAKVGEDIDTFMLVWDKKAIGTATELIGPPKQTFTSGDTKRGAKGETKRDQVNKYIIDNLKDNPIPCQEFKRCCCKNFNFEISESTIERSIRKFGIIAERNPEGIEVWCLHSSPDNITS